MVKIQIVLIKDHGVAEHVKVDIGKNQMIIHAYHVILYQIVTVVKIMLDVRVVKVVIEKNGIHLVDMALIFVLKFNYIIIII